MERNLPVALYMSAWIEIVNCRNLIYRNLVALYMSAWIEINPITPFTSCLGQVALYMSAWIEIADGPRNGTQLAVALYMSAWIEIMITLITFLKRSSHSI
ncbi:hypothetical protein B0G66_103213 [Bacillus badius]|nr:hypothetical protein B0G66_103213 [Bacillus badius]